MLMQYTHSDAAHRIKTKAAEGVFMDQRFALVVVEIPLCVAGTRGGVGTECGG